jgi:PAS domain S-box-containing protein
MRNKNMTRGQLIKKPGKLRQRIVEMENTKAELKQVQELLQKERETFFPILHKAPYGIALIDNDEKFIYINPAFTNITGYTLEDIFAGRDWFHRASLFPEYRQEIINSWKGDVIQEGVEKIFSIVCKNGEIKEIEFKPTLLDDGRIVLILSDITERKLAEVALRESEKKYKDLSELLPQVVFETDERGHLTFANRNAFEIFGYAQEDFDKGLNVFQMIVSESQDRAKENFNRILRQGESRGNEYPLLRKDGSIFYGIIYSTPVIREDKPVGVRGIIVDITDRKQAEESLRIKDNAIESSINAIFFADLEGNLTYVNPSFIKLWGYEDEKEVLGKPILEFWQTKENAQKALKTLHESRSWMGELVAQRKDGSTFDAQISANMVTDKAGKPICLMASFVDITGLKRAEEEKAFVEEQLRQSQKMEAIGRLAGGIAHDFNNLLTVIKGYSQLLLIELKEDVPLRGNIEEIKRASDKAADLTRQLLAFSRRQILEMRVLDLNTVLRDLDKMLHRLIGEDIELVTVFTDDLGRVKTDPGWVEQIIMNLGVNARDAIPEGGKLTIETANVELDETYARGHIAVKPGRYVMLSVSDTGVGMTPEVRQQVFEPFFTTKEKGKGTGLGLSTVYGIVKQSGGNIWVYSEPGKGTTFKIYLPRVDEPLEELRRRVEVKEVPRGTETILIVEDEEDVLKLTGRILSRQGYKVLEASQGLDAFLIAEKYEDLIHLLVTDVVMPKIGGRELADRIAEIRPEIKVLYMSGYTDNAIVHHGVLREGMKFIQKPFTVEGLARKVREVLDKDLKPVV